LKPGGGGKGKGVRAVFGPDPSGYGGKTKMGVKARLLRGKEQCGDVL